MTRKVFACISLIIFLFVIDVTAQDSLQNASISYSGYVDAYIAGYTDSLGVGEYQKYTTVSPRSNQFGLNIAMLTAKYSSKDIHGTITLHYGDIPRSSWSGNYNVIQEANVGVRLSDKLWIDGGFFRTHIGTEALLPKENYTSSLAVPTYFEPYYQAGLKLSYTPSDKLTICLHALNGYNIFEDTNRKKSGGLLVTYVFSEKLNAGYSGYYGDDSPVGDAQTHFRLFNNFFVNYKGNKVKITAGVDIASQQNSAISDSTQSAMTWGTILIVSYHLSKKFDVYGRGEIFNDPDGMLSGTFQNFELDYTGLKIIGGTLGIQYKPTANSYVRLEGRTLVADDKQLIFYWNDKITNNRLEAMLNVGFWFE